MVNDSASHRCPPPFWFDHGRQTRFPNWIWSSNCPSGSVGAVVSGDWVGSGDTPTVVGVAGIVSMGPMVGAGSGAVMLGSGASGSPTMGSPPSRSVVAVDCSVVVVTASVVVVVSIVEHGSLALVVVEQSVVVVVVPGQGSSLLVGAQSIVVVVVLGQGSPLLVVVQQSVVSCDEVVTGDDVVPDEEVVPDDDVGTDEGVADDGAAVDNVAPEAELDPIAITKIRSVKAPAHSVESIFLDLKSSQLLLIDVPAYGLRRLFAAE